VVALARPRGKQMRHVVLGDDVQLAIASQATGKRRSAVHEIELPQHLDQLSRGLRLAQEVASHDDAVLEHTKIASEQHAVLRGRNGDNLVVGTVIAILRVEAREPEVSSEPTKMDVGDEARLGLRRWLEANGITDVEYPDPRIHRNAIAIADAVPEVHGPAVHNEQVYLRMRNAEPLDEILD
jgi:hypothetical protein